MVVFRIISALLGYLFGLFPTGVLYGNAHHVDIRSKGSGNTGTTNSLRVLGWKAGVIVFLGDCLKAVAAMVIIWFVAKDRYPDTVKLLELYAGFGAVLGHNFPFYLHFKGGKGIAVSAAVIVVSNLHPVFIGVGLAVFILVVAVTRYVSLGSLIVVWYIPIFTLLYYRESDLFPVILIVSLLFTILAYIKHKANIIRLIHGTENKFGEKKEKKSEEN